MEINNFTMSKYSKITDRALLVYTLIGGLLLGVFFIYPVYRKLAVIGLLISTGTLMLFLGLHSIISYRESRRKIPFRNIISSAIEISSGIIMWYIAFSAF